jgi:hypothetical protein|tara:strand:+ start:1906 stop:2154 length:249 start_codon:yes stop_codon:yes gene_type:complete
MQKEPFNTANLDIASKTTPIVCEACGNETFKPIFFLRKISRFLTGEKTDRVLPMDSLACVKCNTVNKEFNPNPTKVNKKEDE